MIEIKGKLLAIDSNHLYDEKHTRSSTRRASSSVMCELNRLFNATHVLMILTLCLNNFLLFYNSKFYIYST